MGKAAALLAILVVRCGQATSVSQPASSTRLGSPTPSGLPPPVGRFSCRLPIGAPDGQGAFITFPAATVSFDPKGSGLHGNGGAYYDRAVSRWLPVNRSAVSSS